MDTFNSTNRGENSAFSRIDLAAVVAIVAIGGSLTLSAVSTNKSTAQAVQCIENESEMMRAWTLYAQSNGGLLPPNQDNGAYGNWAGGDASSGNPSGQTNYGVLNNTWTPPTGFRGRPSALGDYLPDFRVFQCPAVTNRLAVRSLSLSIVRNYSMNSAVGMNVGSTEVVDGSWLTGSYGQNTAKKGPFRTYGRISSFDMPGPSHTLVIVQEDVNSLNDCVFAANAATDQWIDWPASVHESGATFSFADGHVVVKHWVDKRTILSSSPVISMVPGSPDAEWLRSVVSARSSSAITTFNSSP